MLSVDFECCGGGGIAFVERDKVAKISEELGNLLNVVVDVDGETALPYDYPGEEWQDVWERELGMANKLCENGLMFVGLLPEADYHLDLSLGKIEAEEMETGLIEVTGSPILIVEAGELIQKIGNPGIDMEIIGEIAVEPGIYSIQCSQDHLEEDRLIVGISPAAGMTQVENVVEL